MDLNKLTQSEKVIGASAIALFVFSFMPWYGKGSGSRNGWDYFLFGVIPVLLAILMLGQIAIVRFSSTKLPEIPVSWAQAHLIAGGLAALLVLLKLIIGDKAHFGITGLGSISITLDRKYGLFLSVIAALGLVAGAYMKTQDPAEAAPPAPPAPPAV